MKLTVNCSYHAQNGAEIVTVEKITRSVHYGDLWFATLVDGTPVAAYGDEILVES